MKRVLTAILFVVASVVALCQDDMKVEQLGLAYITADKVQAELKLTPAQKDLVKREFDAYLRQTQTILKGVTQQNEKEKKLELKRVQDGVSARILGNLTQAQRLRLRQLVLQIKGSWALVVPEIKRALKITPEQEKTIRACQREVLEKVSALERQRQQQLSLIPRPANQKDQAAVAAYKKKVEEQLAAFRQVDIPTILGYENEGKAKALKVLTEPQRKAWAQMLGPKWNAK